MEHLDGILKLVGNELEAVKNNGKFRSRDEIDSVYKLIDIAKDIYCIEDMEEDEGSSYGYYPRSYNDGSYARGRRNARRDSMGRYSREGSYRDDRMMRGYSRDGREEYIDTLRSMMEDAPDEQTRQSMKRMIDSMQ